jgi:nicotinamide-nucleotide amidase
MPTEAMEVLHRVLIERGLTIACAESLTVGGVATHLGECSGSSVYFRGGVVAYTLEMKVKLLGVDEEHARGCNCVSHKTATQMVYGALKLFGTDVAIATTGYAEPDAEQGVEIPYAWIAVGVRNPDDPDKADIHYIKADVTPGMPPANWDMTDPEQAANYAADCRTNVQEEIAYAAAEYCVRTLDPTALDEDDASDAASGRHDDLPLGGYLEGVRENRETGGESDAVQALIDDWNPAFDGIH